jgi:PAS domain S-box-containing protein
MSPLELGLLDQVPTGVVITTQDGKIAYWNRGAETLYGWSRRDVLRRPLAALSASAAAAAALSEAFEAVTSGGLWSGQVALKQRGGVNVAADLRCAPLQNADEEMIGIIFIAAEAAAAGRERHGEAAACVGRRIAQARKEAGLTQQELAERVGVTRRSVQGYESGAVLPYRHLERLAEILDRSPPWLLAARMAPDLEAEVRDVVREELVQLASSSER